MMLNKMIRVVAFLVLNALSFTGFSQKVRTFNSMVGCQVLYPNMTLEEARQGAVKQVKINALNEAGLTEEIASTQILKTTDLDGRSSDQFFETITSDVRGEISYFEEKNVKQIVGKAGEIMVCVEAEVSVAQYNYLDKPQLSIIIDHLKQSYKNGDQLRFNLQANKNGFIWVFVVDQQGNFSLIYPSAYDQGNDIKAGISDEFPQSSRVKWNVTTAGSSETNDLLIVYSLDQALLPEGAIKDFNSWSHWYQGLKYSNRVKLLRSFQIIR